MPPPSLCDIVAELQDSLLYSALIFLKCIICALGGILTAVQWKRRGVGWLVNANSMAFFTFYYATITAMGVIYAGLYAFEFTRLRFPCFEFDYRYLLVVRSFAVTTLISSHYIMVSLSLERLYSSLFPHRFERSNGRAIAIVVGSVITVFCCVMIFYAMSNQFKLFSKTKSVATIDLRIPENVDGYAIAMNIISYSVIVSGVIFVIDIYLNYFRTSRHTPTLGVNYQFSENRTVISTLLPIEITNSVMTIFASLAQVIYAAVNPKNVSFLNRALFTEFVVVSPVYPLAFAILIELRIGFRKKRTIVEIIGDEADHNHFAMLNTAWGSTKA